MNRSSCFGLAAFALLGGCATTLTVRNMDPDNEKADVYINGRMVGHVAYGESLSLPIADGQHRLKATRPGESENAWLDGGGEWKVVVLDDVVLSLLPKPDRTTTEEAP